jgi:hypothetical protein
MGTLVNTSAGVYVSVEDRSQNLTSKQKVSIGAIVLFASQGPVDQLVKITKGSDEFISVFGNPDPLLGYGSYCAITALRWMPELYVTRVHNDARYGGLKCTLKTGDTKLSLVQFDTPKSVDPYDPNKFYLDTTSYFDDVADFFYVYGATPSTINADIRVSIANFKDASDSARPNTFQILVWSKGNSRVPLESWTVSREHQVDGYGRQLYMDNVINGRSKYIRVLNNALNKDTLTATLLPTATSLQYLATRGTAQVGTPQVGTPQVGTAQVGTAAVGTFGQPGYVAASADYAPASPNYVPASADYTPASSNYAPASSDYIPPSTLAFLSAGHNGNTKAYGSTDAIETTMLPLIYNGDQDPFPSHISDPPIPYKNSGWKLYADREEVAYDLMINGGVVIPSVQARMVEIAEKRGDVFVILDVPYDAQGNRYDPSTKAISFRYDPLGTSTIGDTSKGIDSADAALYTPWVEILDKYTGRNMVVPISGHIAAIYCKTDIDYATWFAPAGLKRGILEDIDSNFAQATMVYHQQDRDDLHDAQVNCTRVVQGIGTAIWDATTLQKKDSALSNVSVVRLLKYCTRNVNQQLLYNVFDPNDPFLRAEIKHRLDAILEPIKLNRGLTSYLVVCAGPEEDNSNNTYQDIADGNINVDVYLEPVIPAKKIFVKLIVNKAGAVLGAVQTI